MGSWNCESSEAIPPTLRPMIIETTCEWLSTAKDELRAGRQLVANAIAAASESDGRDGFVETDDLWLKESRDVKRCRDVRRGERRRQCLEVRKRRQARAERDGMRRGGQGVRARGCNLSRKSHCLTRGMRVAFELAIDDD